MKMEDLLTVTICPKIQIVIFFLVKMKSAFQSQKKVIGCMSQVFIHDHATFVHIMYVNSMQSKCYILN